MLVGAVRTNVTICLRSTDDFCPISLAMSLYQRMVRYLYSSLSVSFVPTLAYLGTIRLWQTTPGKTYGLWQGNPSNGS